MYNFTKLANRYYPEVFRKKAMAVSADTEIFQRGGHISLWSRYCTQEAGEEGQNNSITSRWRSKERGCLISPAIGPSLNEHESERSKGDRATEKSRGQIRAKYISRWLRYGCDRELNLLLGIWRRPALRMRALWFCNKLAADPTVRGWCLHRTLISLPLVAVKVGIYRHPNTRSCSVYLFL